MSSLRAQPTFSIQPAVPALNCPASGQWAPWRRKQAAKAVPFRPGCEQPPRGPLKYKTDLEGGLSCLRELESFFLLQSQPGSFSLSFSGANKLDLLFIPGVWKMVLSRQNTCVGSMPKCFIYMYIYIYTFTKCHTPVSPPLSNSSLSKTWSLVIQV